MNLGERQKVLIVDDERVNRSVLAELLKGEHQVLLAKSGGQALERLAQNPTIDLILLDVMMPDMDGYEVLRRLKDDDKTKDIPVIFITALNSVGDEESGFRLGASDYIGKPFSPVIVQARVANLLSFVRQRKMLEVLAGRDGLTEIANRRLFDETLEREWNRSQRNGRPFSLALLDIDYFKQYNDRYGHAGGDSALKQVARALTCSLRRPTDFVARYGGEEFVLILPDTDAAGGREVAENVRTSVEQLAIPHEVSSVAPCITVSVGGLTDLGSGRSAPNIIEAADEMLYEAKRQGRNRVVWNLLPSPMDSQEVHAKESGKIAAMAAIKEKRILVVEDHPFNQLVAKEFLEDAGATVCVANNGKEALDQLRQQTFECVLMDVQMPVMDGLEATRLIRADATLAKTPVIALTANTSGERYLAAGMNDFIAKPFKLDNFYTTIAKWMPGKLQP